MGGGGLCSGTKRLKHRMSTPGWNYNHTRAIRRYNRLTKMEDFAVTVTVISISDVHRSLFHPLATVRHRI
jgi:hypothetical protein